MIARAHMACSRRKTKMALTGKQEELIHVPWSSAEEWHRVYKKIYSGDFVEQTEAHEVLLVWKARISKLPVGVECTLGLLQVCLRDREWTPKILSGQMPNSHENDLRMMYSTAIMKFLNHISNMAHKKQTSLFVIAKQLNIPDWIVDLRHDTAHGHELPSIDIMRIVANILLTWLHEEYWAAEANNMQTSELDSWETIENEQEEKLINLIELWTAVNLYIKVRHIYVSDLPDKQMRKTLGSLVPGKKIHDHTKLPSVMNILLEELSKSLNKDDSYAKQGKVLIDSILNNEAFLASSEILLLFGSEESDGTVKNCLPKDLIDFWKDILLLLQEKKLLVLLFLEVIEFIKNEKDQSKKLLASLWVKALAQAFNKQKIARGIFQTLEQKQKLDNGEDPSTSQALLSTVWEETDNCHPELKDSLSLNVIGDFPNCLTDKSFVKRLILHSHEFSEHYVPEILKISSILNHDPSAKNKMLKLLKVQSHPKHEKMETENTDGSDKIYTIQDLPKVQQKKCMGQNATFVEQLADDKNRNSDWKLAEADHVWSTCPIGVLPWQIDDFQPMEPLTVLHSEVRYAVLKTVELTKIVDSNRLKLHSKIQWENLIKKKKQKKTKLKSSEPTVIGRVVENVKSMQDQS